MNPQIEQLRKQFDAYNDSQKIGFIDKLTKNLQKKYDPEYSKFLHECVQKCDRHINNSGGSQMERINSDNSVANWLRLLAAIELICSVILGSVIMIMLENIALLFSFIIAGIISWLTIIALAEIIQILHDIRNNTRN